MGLDTNLFSVITNPIDKLVKETSFNLVDTAENAVVGELSKAFQSIGLGNGSNKNILGNLGEQVLAGIAGEIFGAIGREMNISSKGEIEDYRGVLVDSESRDRDNILTSQVTQIGKNKTVKPHTFPPDLNDFYVQLDFKEYRRPAPSVPATVDTVFSIALPLPRTLEDKHDIRYNDGAQLGILGAIVNQAQNGATADGNFDGSMIAYGGRELVRSVFGDEPSIMAFLSQSVGAAFNTHQSVLFEQPTLRKHNMSWLLAPNNPAESEKIREIIKLLKGASLPAFSRETNGNANINILTFPLMCKITLFPWGDVGALSRLAGDVDKAYNSNMYTFKHCVIETIKVNYAPSNPAFFADDGNAPAFIGLDISFLEIEYFTADDFGRAGKNADFLEAGKNIVGDIIDKNFSELSPEEQKEFNAKLAGRINDGSAGATPAQATTTNNFNANNTVVRSVTPENFDSTSYRRLYQTSDGSWYKLNSVAGKDVITPIDSLTDPIFAEFGVDGPSISGAPTTALRWPATNNIVKIQTGDGGQLQMASVPGS